MSESTNPPVVMPGGNAIQPRFVLWLITIVAVGLSLFQLYSAGIQPLGLFYQRSIHLMLIMMLAFLMFPVFGPGRKRGILGWLIDAMFFAGALVTGGYLVLYLDEIISRAGFWSQTDILVGCIATLTVLEASRRAVGFGMTLIGALAIVYAFAGPRGELPWLGQFMPGILEHRGYNLDRVAGQLYLGQEGIFGLPLGVAATYIFIFVLFGAFLESTGAGKFFIDMAYAATGRQRGGPAKAAVIASAGMGSISGSAIAKQLNADLAIIDKRRPQANQAQVMHIIGEIENRTCVVVDDMIDTAGTLCKAGDALKAHGARRVVAYATHPILSGPAVDNITGSVLDEVVVTDTIPLSDVARRSGKIRQLSVAGLIAEAIRRVSNEESVSAMFH